jgi:adenine-specific DNA-methyltransferase
MKFETPNLTAENVAKIAELFPGVVTEGKVNFDLLRSMLGDEVYGNEAYEFTWVGKRAAIAEAGRPIRKTLRPCPEESRDWDTTENLYIEGDNLDVLKLLQESYLGKVKMIYIDPPYNTGNDFVYRDIFKTSREDYEDEAGVYDEEGDRLFKNTETNGRFHSDWCSMIYPRLVLARNILKNDGAIFISIDDGEVAQLKKICDEVFGVENFIGEIIWKRKRGRDNSARWFSKAHEYLLLYAKSKNDFKTNYLELDEETKKAYKNPDNDPRGIWRMLACWARGTQGGVSYDFTTKSGQYFPKRLWLFSKQNLTKLDEEDKLVIRGDNIYRKMFITENKGKIPETLWDTVSNAANAADEIKRLFDEKIVFDTPKPIPYILEMLRIATNPGDVILDFFSGSATTAHAVMQLNAEDGGKRKFIMVQLPEVTDEKSEAYKAGYKNICEIGKERIRRAGDKIKAEAGLTALNLDIGFRVLKLDDTNMNDVYYAAGDYTQELVLNMESNIKPDRTDLDLLYGCLLDWGLPLSMPHTHEKIDGFTIHTYNDGDLIACFEERISEKAIREIASRKPLRAVFRDSSFNSSPEKINVFEIFKLLAPNTNVRVI